MSVVRFEERQRFESLLYVALFVLHFPIVLFLTILGFATAETVAQAVSLPAFVILLFSGELLLLYVCTLRVTVTDDAVRFRFFPYHRRERRIPLEEIESVQRGTESSWPSGLGIHWTPEGWHYRTSTSGGVSIERTSDRSVFLGSQHEDDLYLTIQKARWE